MSQVVGFTLRARRASCSVVLLALTLNAGCAVRKPVRVVSGAAQDALSDWIAAVNGGIEAAGSKATVNEVAGRNLGIAYSEAAVMARYAAVRSNLMNGRAVTKVLFDVVELGLTAAVPISNGTRGKTILGSLATGFKGTNLSIDRNVFNEQSTATILSAMDTCVLRQQRAIAGKLAQPVEQYTIYNGYADLSRLYGCTTLAGALQELSENQAVAAKAEQERTLIAPLTRTAVDELGQIQTAFAASVSGDKKLALAFLQEFKVQGLTETSDAKEFIAAYRTLATVLEQPGEVERFIAAARKVKLIAAASN